jgi:hypothetical protein
VSLACVVGSTVQKSQQLLKAVDIIVRTYTRNKDWRQHVNGEGSGLRPPGVLQTGLHQNKTDPPLFVLV